MKLSAFLWLLKGKVFFPSIQKLQCSDEFECSIFWNHARQAQLTRKRFQPWSKFKKWLHQEANPYELVQYKECCKQGL